MRTSLAVLLLAAGAAHADSYDVLLRRYEKQINQQEKQLGGLRNRLLDKEREANRWQEKAESAKGEWSEAGAEVDKTKAAVQNVRGELRKAKTLAEAAEWSVTERTLVAKSAEEQLAMLTRQIYEDRTAPVVTDVPTGIDSLPEMLLNRMVGFSQEVKVAAREAKAQEVTLRSSEMSLQNREQKQAAVLDKLHSKQQDLWLRWQEANRRKQALEEEKMQMEQSEQALRVMLEELRDHREHALAARQGRATEERALAGMHGTLPWPAEGVVVQNFGRQYSDELKQLLISNGIKIETGKNRMVRAVDAGKVLFAQPFQQFGQLVIVQHKTGLTSVYGSLGSTRVKVGDMLQPLDVIGSTSDRGSFYFELRHDEQPVNPLVYLAPNHRSDLSLGRKYK